MSCLLMVLTGVKKLLGCIKGLSEEAKCNLVWEFIASAHWFYCEYYDICCQPMLSYKINKQQGKLG